MTNSSPQEHFDQIVIECLENWQANSLSDIPIKDEPLLAYRIWATIYGLMTETGPEELGTELLTCYLNSPYLYILFSSHTRAVQEGEQNPLLAGVFDRLCQFFRTDAEPKLRELLDKSLIEYCKIRKLNPEELLFPLNNA